MVRQRFHIPNAASTAQAKCPFQRPRVHRWAYRRLWHSINAISVCWVLNYFNNNNDKIIYKAPYGHNLQPHHLLGHNQTICQFSDQRMHVWITCPESNPQPLHHGSNSHCITTPHIINTNHLVIGMYRISAPAPVGPASGPLLEVRPRSGSG